MTDDPQLRDIRKLPTEDAVQGALYDEKGFAYLLFVRSRPGAYLNRHCAMAQSTDGRVFRIRRVEARGLPMFRKSVFTLEAVDGTVFEFTPGGYWDAQDGAVLGMCAAVMMEMKCPPQMFDYTPDDYWKPFDQRMIDELLANIRTLRKSF